MVKNLKNLLMFLVLALVAALPATALAQEVDGGDWLGITNDWSDPDNWENGLSIRY